MDQATGILLLPANDSIVTDEKRQRAQGAGDLNPRCAGHLEEIGDGSGDGDGFDWN